MTHTKKSMALTFVLLIILCLCATFVVNAATTDGKTQIDYSISGSTNFYIPLSTTSGNATGTMRVVFHKGGVLSADWVSTDTTLSNAPSGYARALWVGTNGKRVDKDDEGFDDISVKAQGELWVKTSYTWHESQVLSGGSNPHDFWGYSSGT